MQIQLDILYREIVTELRAVELRAAELRGQMQLIERLIAEAQQPTMSGEPIGVVVPDKEEHTNGL